MDRAWEREPFQTLSSDEADRIVARARPGRRVVAMQRLEGGRRNTHYRLDLDDGTHWVLRLYAVADGRHEVEAAVHQVVARDLPVPRILDVGHDPALHAQPYALLEFLPGTSLDVLLLAGRVPPRALFAELGYRLAAVHRHRHPRIGFFDRTLSVVDPIPALPDLYEPFMEAARERLGVQRLAGLRELLRRHQGALAELDATPALVHGDLRPANLLVSDGRLHAVLDWEFAMAGHALADLGQFLRDEEELPPGAVEALVSGYEDASGQPLPASFRTLCRLRDLLNLLQMLRGEVVRPRQHAEILRLVDRTLRLELARHCAG